MRERGYGQEGIVRKEASAAAARGGRGRGGLNGGKQAAVPVG